MKLPVRWLTSFLPRGDDDDFSSLIEPIKTPPPKWPNLKDKAYWKELIKGVLIIYIILGLSYYFFRSFAEEYWYIIYIVVVGLVAGRIAAKHKKDKLIINRKVSKMIFTLYLWGAPLRYVLTTGMLLGLLVGLIFPPAIPVFVLFGWGGAFIISGAAAFIVALVYELPAMLMMMFKIRIFLQKAILQRIGKLFAPSEVKSDKNVIQVMASEAKFIMNKLLLFSSGMGVTTYKIKHKATKDKIQYYIGLGGGALTLAYYINWTFNEIASRGDKLFIALIASLPLLIVYLTTLARGLLMKEKKLLIISSAVQKEKEARKKGIVDSKLVKIADLIWLMVLIGFYLFYEFLVFREKAMEVLVYFSMSMISIWFVLLLLVNFVIRKKFKGLNRKQIESD